MTDGLKSLGDHEGMTVDRASCILELTCAIRHYKDNRHHVLGHSVRDMSLSFAPDILLYSLSLIDSSGIDLLVASFEEST